MTITPPQLHVQGLATSLADLAATLEVRGLHVTVDVTGTEQLDETTEALVYRAAQEAVRNIVRHADASSVTLSVARAGTVSANKRGQELVLRVRDNGCGFETDNTAARGRGSVGLELLAALVISHGGTLTIDAATGSGTEFVLRVALPPSPPATTEPVQERDAHEQEAHEQDIAGALR